VLIPNATLTSVSGYDYTQPIRVSSAVPEPGTFGLLGAALSAGLLYSRKRLAR